MADPQGARTRPQSSPTSAPDQTSLFAPASPKKRAPRGRQTDYRELLQHALAELFEARQKIEALEQRIRELHAELRALRGAK